MIALLIIVVLAGIYILVKGKVNFSKNRELNRPESVYFALLLIVIAFLLYFFEIANDIFVIISILIVVIAASYFLSKKNYEI